MATPWMKLFSEARTDPKLQMLSGDEHLVWFNLLCLANDQEVRGTVVKKRKLLALEVARGDIELMNAAIEKLVELEIITATEDTFVFINWEKRQGSASKPSDSPEETRERQRRSRGQKKVNSDKTDVTPKTPASENVTPCHAESRLDIDRDKEREKDYPPKSPQGDEADRSASASKVVALWNDALVPLGFPRVAKSTPERERHFSARLNDDKRRHSLDWWGALFAVMAQSPFMLQSAKEKARWLTFDWLLNESNLVKIAEGKYNNAANGGESGGGTWIPVPEED